MGLQVEVLNVEHTDFGGRGKPQPVVDTNDGHQ